MIKRLIAKLFGKRIVAGAAKIGLSKTKLVAIIYVLVVGVETLAPAFGWEIKGLDELKAFLGGVGLWTLREGINTDAKPQA